MRILGLGGRAGFVGEIAAAAVVVVATTIDFLGRGRVKLPSENLDGDDGTTGAGSGSLILAVLAGTDGRSLAGLRRGRVANLSAAAFVSRSVVVVGVVAALADDDDGAVVTAIGGELGLGLRPRVANRLAVGEEEAAAGEDLVGVRVRAMEDAWRPLAWNVLAAGAASEVLLGDDGTVAVDTDVAG